MSDARFSTQTGVRTFELVDDTLHITDQRALPFGEVTLACRSVAEVAAAIETLAVRGAPAIGGVAALGVALAALRSNERTVDDVGRVIDAAIARLRVTRPTAVNLFVALDRVAATRAKPHRHRDDLVRAVVDDAESICREDAAMCARIGAHGAALFDDGDRVITICHTGALATCGIGTALGAIRTAHEAGKKLHVFALETRPLLQGARLTAWECTKLGIPVTLLTDGMAAFALRRQGITKAIVGADRIAANGDTANKIGTYGLATLAAAHDVPFYVAAPSTTFHRQTATGDDIVIEERAPEEVTRPRGVPFTQSDVPVWNPAFDVTPSRLVRGFVDENGVHSSPP